MGKEACREQAQMLTFTFEFKLFFRGPTSHSNKSRQLFEFFPTDFPQFKIGFWYRFSGMHRPVFSGRYRQPRSVRLLDHP